MSWRPARPTLRLDQPVVLAIHDRKVYQQGLSIPLGHVARVEMEGTVGFDKTLDLRVSVPLAQERFANVPVLSNIAGAIRPTIPIQGTLSAPKIDGKALAREMAKMGLNVAGQAGLSGLDALLNRLTQPRDPAEEARRRAEAERQRAERKQRQEQKKFERQRRRGRSEQ